MLSGFSAAVPARLYFHLEAARGLEQSQQGLTERDVLEQLVEDRLANRTDRALELVHRVFARYPAGFDVGLCDALMVALEEARKFCAR